MQNKITEWILPAFAVILFLLPGIFAQVQISKSVVGNGGIELTGTNNHLNGTVGQAAIGLSGNPANISQAGFWYQVGIPVTSIGPVADLLPTEFRLEENYPNPFNPVTAIVYALPKPTRVRLAVYDLLGREVAVLVNKDMQPGEYKAIFDGAELPSGIYFYRIEASEFIKTMKLVLLK